MLTPGVYNSAYFEHTLLARMMGVELVEGRDLICSGGVVKMRTTQGEQPIDVIYRRIDDEYLDPVHFRPDSMLGVTGLVAAIRSGRVSVANAIGNGVADDKLIYSYVPDLTRHYLDEDPILPNVDTYRCNEPDALAHVIERLDEMVVKPVDGSGGKGLVIGPAADGRHPRRAAPAPAGGPARLDRPAGRPAVDGADAHRRSARAAARRPAARSPSTTARPSGCCRVG